MNRRASWSGALVTAWWALRSYAGSTVPVVLVTTAALAVAIPAAALRGLSLAPIPDPGFDLTFSDSARPAAAVQGEATATLVAVLTGLAIGVIAVAMLSVLALGVVRTDARARDIAVRRAVGATRVQVRASGLAEGVALAIAGLVLAAPAGLVAARLAFAGWPGGVAPLAWTAPAAAALALVAVVVSAALFPTLILPRDPRAGFGATTHGLAVPALQLGAALAILVAAGQLRRAAGGLTGSSAQALANGTFFDVSTDSSAAGRAAAYGALVRRLGADHTLDVVSLESAGVARGFGASDGVLTDCGACAIDGVAVQFMPALATLNAVSPDTFRALGVPVLHGRVVTSADDWHAPRVAVISRDLAQCCFEDHIGIGRRILLGHSPDSPWFTVVGVVENHRATGVGGTLEPLGAVYLSAQQLPPHHAELLVRPRRGGGVERVAGVVRAVGLTPAGAVTETAAQAAAARPVAWFARAARLAGWCVLVLAVLGMFAVMQLYVQALAPELAIRRAVGARRAQVLGYVLLRAVGASAVGVVVGYWLGTMTSDALADTVGGLPARGLGIVARPAAALVVAALVGALLPAWRAARAAPAVLAATLEG